MQSPSSIYTSHTSISWICCRDRSAAQISTQTLRHKYSAASNSILIPSCFPLEEATRLRSIVGFINLDHDGVAAHQSIVAASILADNTDGKVFFATAEWLQRQLQQDPSSLSPNALFMFAWRQYGPNDRLVRNICTHLNGLALRDSRNFPSLDGSTHAHEKIGDIRALDEIAECAPKGWRFRPVTCDSKSECSISGGSVLKRTYSCGSEHVIVHPTPLELAKHLRCQSDRRRLSKRQANLRIGKWFHQESVEALKSEAEFRVFIITKADASALRRHKGAIVEMVHTLALPDRWSACCIPIPLGRENLKNTIALISRSSATSPCTFSMLCGTAKTGHLISNPWK